MPADPRAPASHCPELIGAEPSVAELEPVLARIGDRLARTLPAGLARLSGGDIPLVKAAPPQRASLDSLREEGEALSAYCLMNVDRDPDSLPLLAVFDAAPLFRLVDRAFGGPGDVPEPLPDTFPLSAELLLARLETGLAEALGVALSALDGHDDDGWRRVVPVRRDTSLRHLDPFPADADLLALALQVEAPDGGPWSLTLALPITTLAAITALRRAPARHRRALPARPEQEPFASMPLEVTAVLVDMPLSMARLSGLRPGEILPVAVARSVPLRIDGRTLASGTIGEIDDRVAVQVTHAF
ncbi:MAG: flagellar motor switch protein FliM [Novosphingobium lindaniclasticum]|jgi:flagellar motor switch protein FliM|uniref:flagellar motor switch protein FliM n=1 Tax=Novosphingobium lindaniclasticum TaxID=1329895 RepID=UPI002409E530|nr:flagellar motor switch protein FliM [Novosphingobium lindaniclasticum]MDF2639234.1 flagellar motor switch protein FliM [Novosphingobium lindaniclasticum]